MKAGPGRPGILNETSGDNDARARYAREFVAGATVKQLQQAMASGELTSREIVQAYIERIGIYDKQGPALNSVLELNPEALFIAEALDAELGRKSPVFRLEMDDLCTGMLCKSAGGQEGPCTAYLFWSKTMWILLT